MIALVLAAITYLRVFFVSRHRLGLEATALRQQLAVFKRKQSRPRLRSLDRFFWIALRRFWKGWAPDHCEGGYSSLLAPRRVQAVLATAIPPAWPP